LYGGYRVIDADCHVMEPLSLWRERLEPELRAHAPSRAMEVDGRSVLDRLSAEVSRRMPDVKVRDLMNYGITGYDAASQAKAVRTLGAEMAFLYPTIGLWLFSIDDMDAKTAGACIRVYNDWLREFCSGSGGVLRGVGFVNRHDPEEMVPELRRIHSFGFKAVAMRPNPIKGRLLSDPGYEPFWSACEELDMAVGIHEGTYARVPTIGADRFESHFGRHASSHPLEQMLALLALIEGGVLERHPRLRVAFLEAGGGWVPYWLWRLDRTYQGAGRWEVEQNVRMPPSDYFRRQCFVAIEPEEPYLGALIDFIGTDQIILGSDFPHHDHDPDVIREAVALQERLSPATVRKLLWDNPARLYGLES
jgi:uncharacterized protein